MWRRGASLSISTWSSLRGYSEKEAAQIAAQAAAGTDTLTFGSLPPGDA